jgi:signal transduction histidine kinase
VILDPPPRLLELVDATGLETICQQFVNDHEIGVRIFNAQGTPLVDVPMDHGLSDWVFRFPDARRQFTDFVVSLKRTTLDPDEGLVRQDPVTDTRFLLLPITHDFDVLGRLVIGPYLPADARDELPPTHRYAGQMDPMQLARMRSALPHLSDAMMRTRTGLLTSALDLVCHAGWRALITSKVHLESITESYNELQAANDRLAQANARLSQRNARLEEVDKLKSDFVATVSHELRTPLTSVIGYGEMLLEEVAGPLTSSQREYVRNIVARGGELLDLIGNILQMSRLEQGGQPLERQLVNLRLLLDETVGTVQPQIRQRRQSIRHSVSSNLPLVPADKVKLRQVLLNLLANASKFTPEDGRIVVEVRLANRAGRRAAVISVADSGIGVPPGERTQIFEPFYQSDNSSTRAYGGTGLGLSIVQTFVEMHGGVVLVGDAPLGGAQFTVVLPIDKKA